MRMHINLINTKILPISFEYFAPHTVEEALSILDRYGQDAKVLAGGTDLLVKMKQRLTEPRCVINIKSINELNFIREEADELHIGAVTKLRTIEKSDIVKERFPVLYEGVRAIGSVQIRNMATIGGNLCNASPAADSAPPLLVLNAKLRVIGPEGDREIPIERFFLGPGKTALQPTELLAEIRIPYLPKGAGTSFIKIARTGMDIAKINIAVMLRLNGNEIDTCRIALGAVAPTPLRIHKAEEFLTGKKLDHEMADEVAQIVAEEIRPITDIRATAEYRREVSKALTRDALLMAQERARRW
jgi:carbon-monoxide dehydrogenase medium subunit